jgi:hypothetical protein
MLIASPTHLIDGQKVRYDTIRYDAYTTQLKTHFITFDVLELLLDGVQ